LPVRKPWLSRDAYTRYDDRSPSPRRVNLFLRCEMAKSYNVAVVGATGIVGAELLGLLEKRSFPLRSLKLLASPRSAGKRIRFGEQDIEVEVLSHDSFEGCDLVFNAIPDETSKEYSPSAVKASAIVIDKTGAWRMDPDVPLVVP